MNGPLSIVTITAEAAADAPGALDLARKDAEEARRKLVPEVASGDVVLVVVPKGDGRQFEDSLRSHLFTHNPL